MALQIPPSSWDNPREAFRILFQTLRAVGDGRSNARGSITLTASQATSTLTDRRIGTDSVITLMPTTANAAAEIGNGTMYLGTVTSGSATITHANNAQVDRTFTYSIQG